MTVSVAQALHDGAASLHGIADNPRREARLLLASATGLTQNDLIRHPGNSIDPTLYQTLLARRRSREPLALIIGHREFWSMDFEVSPVTLIPRPDSETLIEAALATFTGRPPPEKILDLGTGTGCLLLALLQEFPSSFGIGIDLAPDAAALASRNSSRLGLSSRSAFLAGDWADPLRGRFDLIVANPPYIVAGDIERLMPEVAGYEPRLSLSGGQDGYDAYREIVPALRHHLEPSGVAILELGAGQSSFVTDLVADYAFSSSLRVDLAKIPRAIIVAFQSK